MAELRVNWTRDEIILACALTLENGWVGLDATDERVQELSALLNASPLHPLEARGEKFRNPNGVARKTWDIASRHPEYTGTPTNGNKLDREVLHDFLSAPGEMAAVARELRDAIVRGDVADASEPDLIAPEAEAREGRLLLARHLRRERNPALRAKKLKATKEAGLPVACEVCSFDFRATYGERGTDYIEIHHVLPLHASGERATRLRDLVLLCANCHRMIHRGKTWITPDDLRELLAATAPLPS